MDNIISIERGIGKQENDIDKQLIFINIENFSFNSVFSICSEYSLPLLFAYTDTKKDNSENFTLVFRDHLYSEDDQYHKVFIAALNLFFPKEVIKKPVEIKVNLKEKNIFHYGNHRYICNIVDLLFNLHARLKEKNPTNYPAKMKKFCKDCNLQMKNSFPYIIFYEKDNHNYVKEEKLINCVENYIYNYRNLHYLLDFGCQNIKTNSKRKLLKDVDFTSIQSNCCLYKNFKSGVILPDPELFGLATNLLTINGGYKRFLDVLKNIPEYSKKVEKYKTFCTLINKTDHPRNSCDMFCHYCTSCRHGTDIINTCIQRRGTVAVIENYNFKELKVMENECKQTIEMIIRKQEPGIDLTIIPTGIGKTEVALDYANPHSIFAFPTHKLKSEAMERAMAKGKKVVVTPELPKTLPPHIQSQINNYYRIGSVSKAALCIRYYAKDYPELKQYLQDMEYARNSNDAVFTTHEKLLFMASVKNKDTIVIDEDILPTLLKQSSVSWKEIDKMPFLADENHPDYKTLLTVRRDIEANMNNDGRIIKNPEYVFKDLKSIMDGKEVRRTAFSSLTQVSDLFGFLNCDYYIIQDSPYEKGKKIINFITIRDLPKDKHIVILSATANSWLYERLFGDRVRIHDLGYVKNRGKLIQDLSHSFSRSRLYENPEYLKILSEMVGNDPVITFKEFLRYFKNPVAHFGALEGLDHLKGQNLWIIGTPHLPPTAYVLYAKALGFNLKMLDQDFHNEIVENRGMRFPFYVPSYREDLQKIQMSFIESELLQAVGRARLVREDCTVRVFSNFPLVKADEYINLYDNWLSNRATEDKTIKKVS